MNLNGKTIVVGTGKSGVSAALLLHRNGYDAVLYDENEKVNPEKIRSSHPDLKDTEILTGTLPDQTLESFQNAVLSPGVPLDTPFADRLREKNIRILGEIELAYLFAKGKIIGITGTNGKTTTTTLVGEIMKRKYDDVYVVGNIGNPYTDIADRTSTDSVTVIELSSFQLETVDSFHADAAAILNITPDHLNRHHTMENYAACKKRVTNRQTKQDVCVLNADNSYTASFAEECPARPVLFSSSQVLSEGYYLQGGDIFLAQNGTSEKLMNVHEMSLVGVCNAENVMAAIAIGRAMHVPMDEILDTVRHFKAVPHRIEYVTEKRGVRFYNDSKGTNPDAAIQAVRAMDGKICLIAGGFDKEIPFDDWIRAFEGKVKKLVLIGQTAKTIARTAEKYGFRDYVFADSLEQAIDMAYAAAAPGENVLLSPACASWDMFPNYEVRGDRFKAYVLNLKE